MITHLYWSFASKHADRVRRGSVPDHPRLWRHCFRLEQCRTPICGASVPREGLKRREGRGLVPSDLGELHLRLAVDQPVPGHDDVPVGLDEIEHARVLD
jgi:hypothetical protein